jgi:hypothetical protein
MCHLSIDVDQSVHAVAPIFDLIEASEFYMRSIRVVPVAWSKQAAVHLSLGGGSKIDLDLLLGNLRQLPGVLSTEHSPMPV